MMKMRANVIDTPPLPTLSSDLEPDDALVARLQRGDDSAFEAIVRGHGGRLLSVARRFLGNNEDAQDAVQDTFIRAFKAIHTFEARAQLHTWLHRILVNSALMKLRERRRRPTESIEALLPTYTADGHQAVSSRDWSDAVLERKETAAIVRQAIERLPDLYREVLVLRDIE
jgi:RNA polymerase sigma-70 factor (ECF subfamily)